jgi:hypothetical protein
MRDLEGCICRLTILTISRFVLFGALVSKNAANYTDIFQAWCVFQKKKRRSGSGAQPRTIFMLQVRFGVFSVPVGVLNSYRVWSRPHGCRLPRAGLAASVWDKRGGEEEGDASEGPLRSVAFGSSDWSGLVGCQMDSRI